jgi:hypothetical protein
MFLEAQLKYSGFLGFISTSLKGGHESRVTIQDGMRIFLPKLDGINTLLYIRSFPSCLFTHFDEVWSVSLTQQPITQRIYRDRELKSHKETFAHRTSQQYLVLNVKK